MTHTFKHYLPERARILQQRFQSAAWQTVARGGMLRQAEAGMLHPPGDPSPDAVVVDFLCAVNEHAVRARIANGERDAQVLLEELSRWPSPYDARPCGFTFLGLCLTFSCNLRPKCLYCNQRSTPHVLGDSDWRRLIQQAVSDSGCPYVYLTGGEPLLFGRRLYGRDGLVAFATRLGCPVNVNTNAMLIGPEVALQLVASGLSRMHISLDSADAAVHDAMTGGDGRFARVVQALTDLQIAREVLGVNHPIIHINCVMTRHNAPGFPALLRMLLHMKRMRTPSASAPYRADPHLRDFGIHLIPVGGPENANRRLSAHEVVEFYRETWTRAAEVWELYQDEIGVPASERIDFDNWAFFTSAYKRVRHGGTLADYARACEDGQYGRLALGRKCYIVPSQAFVLPDGNQYWCGAHTVARPDPVGNVLRSGLVANIARKIKEIGRLPGPHCRNCATATLYLNQAIEAALLGRIAMWIKEADQCPSGASQ
ncbi:MAG: radical SAM/SPASM domain-containing protein [Armatimonadota bacterium]